MAHRPSAIAACDLLLMVQDGAVRAFGPKDQVLRETTANYPQIVRNAGAPGGITAAVRPAPQPGEEG